jgi:hypothetical protein
MARMSALNGLCASNQAATSRARPEGTDVMRYVVPSHSITYTSRMPPRRDSTKKSMRTSNLFLTRELTSRDQGQATSLLIKKLKRLAEAVFSSFSPPLDAP